jgi:Zn-dependent peptidase ImmA (M78 family)
VPGAAHAGAWRTKRCILTTPEGFAYVCDPGTVRLSVSDVARPLWEALNWAATTHPVVDEHDLLSTGELKKQIGAISDTSLRDFAAVYVPPPVLEEVQLALLRIGALELLDDIPAANVPAIASFSPAVAMFGGVNPNLRGADVEAIVSLMVDRKNRPESAKLEAMTHNRTGRPLGVPHEDGYEFALELWEDLGEPTIAPVDIRGIVEQLGIEIRTERLSTDTIRGVALAGKEFGPTILINASSIYNQNEDGRRFTLAHEFCHLLFDRTRARRVTIASGPCVAPGIEKRANAFAAAFLMPRKLLRQLFPIGGAIDRADVLVAARKLHVSETALVEHIFNFDLISEWDRERLRAAFRIVSA